MTYRYTLYEKFEQSCIFQDIEMDMAEFNIQRAPLGATIYTSLALNSASIVFGWTMEKDVHYIVPILSTFFASYGSIYFIITSSTLLIDLFPGKSGSASAVVSLIRCLVCALGLAVLDKLILSVGPGGTFTLMAGICLTSMSLIYAELRLGQKIDKKRRLRQDFAVPLHPV